MKKVVALSALLLAIAVVLLLVRRHRAAGRMATELRAEADAAQSEAAISPEFLQDAWVVLLPVTRQKVSAGGTLEGVRQADAAMTDLMHKAKTRADWLVWAQIRDYSLAKLLQTGASVRQSPLTMRDPDACVSATMAAMRSKVLRARLRECDRVGLQ